jgi:hypothetical protein
LKANPEQQSSKRSRRSVTDERTSPQRDLLATLNLPENNAITDCGKEYAKPLA